MTEHTIEKPRVCLLGVGDMGNALARSWLAAGHPVTVWNRTPAKADPLAKEGADAAATAAEAVAASDLVVTVLSDDASVGASLADADLTGKDLVNLTTNTPDEARTRAEWAGRRGARFVDGGIMAVPTMVGVPEAGGYVFYSGSRDAFDRHERTLSVPLATRFVGQDAGMAALHDVALLSAMNGLFAGVSHGLALVRDADVDLGSFSGLLSEWLVAMTTTIPDTVDHLESGDYTTDVVSSLAMQVRANTTMLRTAQEQGVSPELIVPYLRLMELRLARGGAEEDGTGVIDLLSGARH
ncbi:NAD(P)-dependent oxidoreductase [Nocardiopsis sp. FIRDI 009]|uniref:NAD(P)-dependent oxidoreductase n=1 Tax=Nocardiopsis sp. FIRDI 009 TaxID=714197 RepID=UPI000E22CB3E|nr:NAD(P)-binding domain-containing protein [Nocardiopsis sp. FIRDI 009]